MAEAPKAATTAEERKAARAARFGIASAETEADAVEKRKAARSARFGLDSNASMTSKQASNDGLSEEQIAQLKKRVCPLSIFCETKSFATAFQLLIYHCMNIYSERALRGRDFNGVID